VAQSRLNLLRALPDHIDERSVQAAVKRYLTHVKAAIERLTQLDESSSFSVMGPAGSARDTKVQS
jgi:predicted component of type VI protein secretion system